MVSEEELSRAIGRAADKVIEREGFVFDDNERVGAFHAVKIHYNSIINNTSNLEARRWYIYSTISSNDKLKQKRGDAFILMLRTIKGYNPSIDFYVNEELNG